MTLAGDDSTFATPMTNAAGDAFVPLVVPPQAPVPARREQPPAARHGEPRAEADPPARLYRSQPKSVIWEVPFDRVTMGQAVERIAELIERRTPSYVITANLNYVMLHHQRPALDQVTREAAMILADGQPIVWRSRWSGDPLPQRVAGSEMIHELAKAARDRGWGIYFLGGEPGVAEACARRLVERYPGLKIAGVESPPFRPLSEQEQREQDARIRRSGADLLLVAFGQPKGEQWIHEHHRRLGVPVSIQLGASFDFIAGTAKRAPRIWQRCGMEWAYRMLSQPRRLAPRYAANARFLTLAMVRDLFRATRFTVGETAEGQPTAACATDPGATGKVEPTRRG